MRLHQTPFALALLTALAACATAPPPPTEYLQSTYGFSPDDAWYARARLGALRIPNCSASLVSPRGLVMTNHHCARDFVTQVTADGENLLDDGFYAATLADERPVEDFEADQLIEIVDVTDEIRAAVDAVTGAQAQSALRDSLTEAVGERIQEERGGEEAGIEVEVISLYNGGLYSAYIFRRYASARLVMAPELQLGYFGGDPDNFTYPRYSLDFAFFRLYDEDDQPLRTDDHFRWSETGSSAGDLVFIIGNPGSTSRLRTVSELEFRRDVEMPALLGFLGSRIEVIKDYIEGREDEPGIDEVRNSVFGLLNGQKAYAGMLRGLEDPYVMARPGASEADFRGALQADPALAEAYQPLFDQMAELQSRKAAMAAEFNAFAAFGNTDYESSLILRTLATFQYLGARQQGAPPEQVEGFIDELKGVANRPRELDEALLAARYRDMVDAFGSDDPSVRALLGGRTVEEAASALMSTSAMADSAGNPGTDEWALPERWLNPSSDFDLSTPLNFVSTADIIGGNSGSPVVNRDLEVVGLVFDGNIQSLPGDYIYVPDLNRSIAVDARGILEALEDIYGAARIVEELTSGQTR